MIRRFLPLVMVAIACSRVDTTALREEFESQHPGCHVKALTVGEGDPQYVRVRYQCTSDSTQLEETWVYERVRDKWTPIAKVPTDATEQPTH